ncbi:MAG: hypothetical protein Q8942_11305 [Bacillota bacterium]|nr:hypothetical protein [Bacillota bacterium]
MKNKRNNKIQVNNGILIPIKINLKCKISLFGSIKTNLLESILEKYGLSRISGNKQILVFRLFPEVYDKVEDSGSANRLEHSPVINIYNSYSRIKWMIKPIYMRENDSKASGISSTRLVQHINRTFLLSQEHDEKKHENIAGKYDVSDTGSYTGNDDSFSIKLIKSEPGKGHLNRFSELFKLLLTKELWINKTSEQISSIHLKKEVTLKTSFKRLERNIGLDSAGNKIKSTGYKKELIKNSKINGNKAFSKSLYQDNQLKIDSDYLNLQDNKSNVYTGKAP